jgi:hypothetical protein
MCVPNLKTSGCSQKRKTQKRSSLLRRPYSSFYYWVTGPMTGPSPGSTGLLCHARIPKTYPRGHRPSSCHHHPCSLGRRYHGHNRPVVRLVLPGSLDSYPDFQIRGSSLSSSSRSSDCPDCYSPYVVPLVVNSIRLTWIGSGTGSSYKQCAVETNSFTPRLNDNDGRPCTKY